MTTQIPSSMLLGDDALPLPNNSVTLAQLVQAVQQALLPTGSIIALSGAATPSGYVAADGSLISRTAYPNLWTFANASLNIAASDATWLVGQYSPGDGSTTFRVPNYNGRMLIGAGAGKEVEQVTSVTAAANAIAVGSNASRWITGKMVTLSGVTGFSGITNGTYYIVRASSTTISFASTLTNAQNNVTIALTGTGSCTITATLTTRSLGESGGEEAHAMNITELLAHTHTQGFTTGATFGAGGGGGGANTGSTGGNNASNVMNPYAGVNYFIKV